jgi:hypothetical protein
MTRAEKRALWALAVVAAGFLPPVTFLTGRPEPFVFGVPLNYLWLPCMVLVTVTSLTLAYRHIAREDGFPDESGPEGGDPEFGEREGGDR